MAAALIHSRTQGVFVIAAAPFTGSGVVDFASIDPLTGFYFGFGIDGSTTMGIRGVAP